MFDILIRNGRLVDGTGSPWFPGDVGIAGDTIEAVGPLEGADAKRVIDAGGQIVCPGFVDCHSHSDLSILANREATSSIYQGVTIEIIGQCGQSIAPITAVNRSQMLSAVPMTSPGVRPDWATCGDFMDRLAVGAGVNTGLLVAHGAVRRAVMGMADRLPTEDEMAAMERTVAEGLDAGALGLSFGLEYAPGSAADATELERLCAVAGARRKLTSWHIRNRDRRFEAATTEAIEVTRRAGAGLQLSHVSAKPGSTPRAWNRVMEQVRLARAAGDDIQCDMIPYVAGPGLLSAILPPWATEGTTAEIVARLRDPAARRKMIEQSERYWLMFHRRQWDRIALSSSRAHPEWVGLTFRQIGVAAGRDPFDCVYDILADEGEGMSNVWITGILFSEGDVSEWISDPLFAIASDGFTARTDGVWLKIANHPNSFGWTAVVIEKYVRELRTLRLEEAIWKMTGLPATRWGLYDRGILRRGAIADVIVFDEAQYRTRATYTQPHAYAEGMSYVLVNGIVALDAGAPTGALAGRVLQR